MTFPCLGTILKNNMKPLTYIILLNWNGWRDTLNCLESLRSLNYPNYKVLVVDNGSNDESVEEIRKANLDAVVLETGKNLGFSGGCNVGIRFALSQNAKFVWLLNNDTTVDADALFEMVNVAEEDPKKGGVGSVIYYMNDSLRIQAWGGGKVSFWTGRSYHIKSQVSDSCLDYLTAASLLLRCSALEKTGLLDEKNFFMYWEDADLCFRLRKNGWKLAVASRSSIWHKESASLGKKSLKTDTYFNASAVRFFYRHATFPCIPISVGVGFRLAKRIVFGRIKNLAAVLQGVFNGVFGKK